MDTDAFTGDFMHALAEALAVGQTVTAWARSKDVFVEIARAWAERPAFLELVERYRLAHAESMVGKIANHVERAIGRLVELSENIQKPAISLSATMAIIDNMCERSGFMLALNVLKESEFIPRTLRLRTARMSALIKISAGSTGTDRDIIVTTRFQT
jgi:hypothetical protein